jgi:hypothetical protein
VQAQGWYRDPYLVHQDRYFSAGEPTKLVRDGGIENYDPPPAGPPMTELVEARPTQPSSASDLRRADDYSARDLGDGEASLWEALWWVGSAGTPERDLGRALIEDLRQLFSSTDEV